MSKLQAILTYKILLVPAWIWLVCLALPVINDFVQRTKWTAAQSLLQLLSRALLTIPVIGQAVQLVPILGDLIRLGTGDAAARATMPKAGIGKWAAIVKKNGAPPAALLLLVPLLFFMMGCQIQAYCKLPEHAGEPKCKALNVTTDCAAPEVLQAVGSILASVTAALLSSDWGNLLASIESQLIQQGKADAWGIITCAVNKVTAHAASLATEGVSAVNQHAEAWKAAHPAKTVN